MAMPGIYSDYLYRLHSCRAFAIPKAWLDATVNNMSTDDRFARGLVDRIEWTQVSSKIFERYESENRPLIVAGAANSWKAMEAWQDADYLCSATSTQHFRATSGAAPLPANFTLPAYIDYCRGSSLFEEAPLYLFDRTALAPNSQLWQDYVSHLARTCTYWDPTRYKTNGHDLFQLLGEGSRPDHTWLIVGPARSGSVFHIDPNATHAWNACIRGRKRWIFYPPSQSNPPPGVHPSPDGDHVALPLSIGEWIFDCWDEHCRRKTSGPLSERPLECTVRPGDVVFVPHGWWHMVINLDEGLNVAITHNYVSRTNLPNVLRFLREKQDQISGCRDRSEADQPHELYKVFSDLLLEYVPDLYRQAMAVSRWTCAAWSNEKMSSRDANDTASSNKRPRPDDESSHSSVLVQAKARTEPFSFSFL